MTARRTGGKPKGLISEIDVDSGSSGPNSPSIDSDDASGRKKTNKTDKELRKIRGKHDENSLWLSDFDPTKGRKARTKLKETAYKDTHVGIVGAKNNKTVRKDSIYDAKGCLIQVRVSTKMAISKTSNCISILTEWAGPVRLSRQGLSGMSFSVSKVTNIA